MANIYSSVDELIGKTPLVRLHRLEESYGLSARILVKLEGMNPGGSAKDRVAREILNDAEARGLLTPDSVIIEPTSGNTGIGLASVGAARGYHVMIVMPDSMSRERQMLMSAYGAEVVLTEGALGMAGAIAKAEELARTTPHAFLAGQFTNPANAQAHYNTTGPEIWEDTDGEVDIFVAGVGTGGTITGVGRYLKEKKPSVQVVAVEPYDSQVLAGEKGGAHGLQGIGAGFIPEVLDTTVYDTIYPVRQASAYHLARRLAREEGILTGISSGAALYAAVMLAQREENRRKTIVVLLPDTGERYLSTPLYED